MEEDKLKQENIKLKEILNEILIFVQDCEKAEGTDILEHYETRMISYIIESYLGINDHQLKMDLSQEA